MNANVETNFAGLLALAASVTAALLIWALLTEPLTIATVVSGHDAAAIVLGVCNVLYDAVTHFLQYF
jgi:hypothetical protein